LGDTEDHNDISGKWYVEWALNTSADSPIFQWFGEAFLPTLLKEPAEYHKPDQDDPLREELLLAHQTHENSLSHEAPAQKALLLCPLPAQVHRLKWWLTKYFDDRLDIFHMYAEMGNDEWTEIQLKFPD
jgi:hypothetical protein